LSPGPDSNHAHFSHFTSAGIAMGCSVDYEALAQIGGMLGHGGLVVFDDTVDMTQQAQFAMEF